MSALANGSTGSMSEKLSRRGVASAALWGAFALAGCGGGGSSGGGSGGSAAPPPAPPPPSPPPPPPPPPPPTGAKLLTGVNVAGLEFASSKLPGKLGTDYCAPSNAELDYYRAAGAKVVRVPFLWERMQPALNGAFDTTHAAALDAAVTYANSKGLTVLLDAHQYGRRKVNGTSYIIGETPTVTAAHFAQFWGAMAQRYKSKTVIYGLTNEPHDQNINTLAATQNTAIASIRATGSKQLVLASGGSWTGAHSWVKSGNGDAMLSVTDPANNFAFDVHQYLDSDSSGTSATCSAASGGKLAAFTAWARTNRRRGFLGEFAGGADAGCTTELTALLAHMRDNRDVWIGWTAWAGGAWWPATYMFTLKPDSLTAPVDKPQMTTLKKYFE